MKAQKRKQDGEQTKSRRAAETRADQTDGEGLSVEPEAQDARKHAAEPETGGSAQESSPTEAGGNQAAAHTEPVAADEALEQRLLRLQADFDNFRKRTLREKAELFKRANEEIMEELLPVLDHMDIAIAAAGKHEAREAFVEGFKLVAEQLLSALGKFGMKPIDVAEGPFDPACQEAISHIPSREIPENHIIDQVRRGYMLGDKLLRAAQVVVSSGDGEGGRPEGSDG